jgi:uncharacterized membrane protein YccF (DUF307 family)
MKNKFENKHSDDPNSLTTDDREVMKKTSITPTDVKDALNENNVAETIATGARVPKTAPKLIFGILLVITGILIAVVTSISIIGIVIGAVFIIAGIILPFSNLGGAGRRNTA